MVRRKTAIRIQVRHGEGKITEDQWTTKKGDVPMGPSMCRRHDDITAYDRISEEQHIIKTAKHSFRHLQYYPHLPGFLTPFCHQSRSNLISVFTLASPKWKETLYSFPLHLITSGFSFDFWFLPQKAFWGPLAYSSHPYSRSPASLLRYPDPLIPCLRPLASATLHSKHLEGRDGTMASIPSSLYPQRIEHTQSVSSDQ